MKPPFTTLLLFIMATITSTMFAQDIIVMKDGSLVKSKVYEITATEIKYKKFTNPEGPFYIIEKGRVIAVNYENGEKDVFPDAADTKEDIQDNASARYVEALPDADNDLIITKYNQLIAFEGKASRKEVGELTCKYGITSGSVLSNKEVEITFKLEHLGFCCQYGINVRNKTEKVIYIDLGNTFRVEQNGEYFTYHDVSEQTTVTHGNASGGSIGLGSVANMLGIGGAIGTLANGVSVGGRGQHSVSTAYATQRIIIIPPHGKNYLSLHKEVEVKPGTILTNKKTKCLSHGEDLDLFIPNIKRGFIHKGETYVFSEKESPYKREYIITYSTEKTFNSYSTVKFVLYLQQIYGDDIMLPHYLYDWYDFIKNIKKRIPDYNSFSIIGRATIAK